jgi:hypothetical protein
MSSFGEVMKRERELRQITLREISEATKINLRYLDALERNDFRHLPGGVFNKGFVRAFAQHIGVDPESMVNAYLEEEQGQQARTEEKRREVLRRTASVDAPIGRNVESASEPNRQMRFPRGLLAGALLLVVALIALGGYAVTRGWHKRWIGAPADPDRSEAGPVSSSPPPAKSSGESRGRAIPVKLVIVRQTAGTVNCDDRERKSFDGLPAGAEINMSCFTFLVVDASDAGAVRLGIDGAVPETLGPDGQPVRAQRIEVASRTARSSP